MPTNIDYFTALQWYTVHVTCWNKNTFENIFYKKRILLARLTTYNSWTTLKTIFHYNLENHLITDFNLLLKHEEDFWKLKSQIQWLSDGDSNTRFFHISTTQCRKHNRILGPNDIVGKWTFDPSKINSIILHHFTDIYSIQLPYCSTTTTLLLTVYHPPIFTQCLVHLPMLKSIQHFTLFNRLKRLVLMVYIPYFFKNIGIILNMPL